MRILPASEAAITEALAVLARGGCIAHATETCYGFAVDLTNPDAVARLFAIKKRPSNQPVSALFASVEEAKQYVEWNLLAEELARKHLPGPLTIILPLRSDAPHAILPTPPVRTARPGGYPLPPTPSIGIRVSSHPVAQELAQRFRKPLSTTSANLHGQPNLYSAEEVAEQLSIINSQLSIHLPPDLLLDSGPLPHRPPSTVIDCTGAEPRTLR